MMHAGYLMAENVLQTLQQLVQDVIAPDVRELKVRLAGFEKQVDVRFNAMEQQVDVRFNAMEQRFDSFGQKSEAQFKALLAAIGESKAQVELANMRLIAALSERVAVLEAQRH